MMRMLALGMVVLALVGASSASGKVRDLYALRYGAETNVLVPYDPVRLVPSAALVIRTGSFGHAWSLSPDHSRFVAAAGWRPTAGKPASLRFVDLAAGRVEGTLILAGEFGRVTATAWVGGRVLAIVSKSSSTTVYTVDPDERTVIAQVSLPGSVVLGERGRNNVVLLLAPDGRIGPATIAVVDRALGVRTVLLGKIAAGMTVTGEGPDARTTAQRPALAISPSRDRAFVFGSANEPAAAIELRTLAVSYRPVRLLASAKKQVSGFTRTAAALPDGRIVVSGFDYDQTARVGLWLVDPKDWSSRVLDTAANWFRVGGGLVFTRGDRDLGLRILDPSGSSRDLFHGRVVGSVVVVGPRALVTFFGTKQKAAVVELGTGRVIARPVPTRLLIDAGQPIVG